MTKKDYELIALAFQRDAAHLARTTNRNYANMTPWEKGCYDQWNTTAMSLADVLAQENPKFDRKKFLAACGVQS